VTIKNPRWVRRYCRCKNGRIEATVFSATRREERACGRYATREEAERGSLERIAAMPDAEEILADLAISVPKVRWTISYSKIQNGSVQPKLCRLGTQICLGTYKTIREAERLMLRAILDLDSQTSLAALLDISETVCPTRIAIAGARMPQDASVTRIQGACRTETQTRPEASGELVGT
jgi:hypothetical protein